MQEVRQYGNRKTRSEEVGGNDKMKKLIFTWCISLIIAPMYVDDCKHPGPIWSAYF